MTSLARQRLVERLGAWGAESVLVVGKLPEEALHAGRTTQIGPEGALQALDSLGRFDVAVVLAPAPQTATDELELVLGRLKNLHAPRILAEADPVGDLAAILRDLAFEPDETAPDLWVYDIDRYNPEREWNTAEDWAHPENFDKYRW